MIIDRFWGDSYWGMTFWAETYWGSISTGFPKRCRIYTIYAEDRTYVARR